MANEKVMNLLSTTELQNAYRNITCCFENELFLRRKTLEHKLDKLIESVLENPTSAKVDSWLAAAKETLNGCLLGKYSGKTAYQGALELLIEATAKEHPETSAKCLSKIYDDCSIEYIEKICEQTKNKACYDVMVTKLKQTYKQNEPKSFYEEVLLYKYAMLAKDSDLLKKAMVEKRRLINVTDKELGLLKGDVDYKPFLEHFKHSGVYSIDVADISPDYRNALKDVVSGHENLERLQTVGIGYAISADDLLPNEALKKIDVVYGIWQVKDAEKLLRGLPNIEKLNFGEDQTGLYEALMTYKPEKLESVVAKFDRKQATALMEKYPDFVIPSSLLALVYLRSRNAAIIKAKKTKSIEDVKTVVSRKGIVEYLKLIAPEDRPTYADLSIPDSSGVNTFDLMRHNYGDDYDETFKQVADLCNFADKQKDIALIDAIRKQSVVEYISGLKPEERPTLEDLNREIYGKKDCIDLIDEAYDEKAFDTLAQVADLCKIGELKKEVELLKAVDEKRVLQYLRELKAEERPSFASLLDKENAAIKGDINVVEGIRNKYGTEDYLALMPELLSLTNATDEDLKMLEKNKDFADIAKCYAAKKKYDEKAVAVRAAFEKWKEEHQKGM